ncbi:hypothetical protein REPUB_Repub20aG0138900 [Reevesia pubescens]
MLIFFYNCTLFPPNLPSIVCLQFNAKNSYVFAEGAIPEFDWKTYCESTVTVPVIEKAAVNGVLSNGTFAGALKQGFELTWRKPDVDCQSCEASGGLCGYSNDQLQNNFFCHCPDGKHSTSCHDINGEGLIKFGPNYPVIGEHSSMHKCRHEYIQSNIVYRLCYTDSLF